MRKLCIDQSLADLYIFEYKKFVLMASMTQRMITPSEQVDHVWHLHLQYPDSYCDLTGKLGLKYFDHTPTTGGPSQEE
jgi:hypothetical protein